jgi:aspartate ammonia-lyase
MSSNFRTEHDFLGEKQIPAFAYWGVHTARAVENFAISGTRVSAMPDLVRALAFVKKAATRANADLGAIDRERAAAIILACEDLIEGKLLDEFVVDVIQGGAGTSTNMNANEVICNLALEKLGHEKGATTSCIPTTTSTPRRAPTTSIRRRCGWRCGLPSAGCSNPWRRCARASKPRRSNSRTS